MRMGLALWAFSPSACFRWLSLSWLRFTSASAAVTLTRGNAGRWLGTVAMLLINGSILRGLGEGIADEGERTEIRFAFARSMFVGVNENDARAAMKVYAQTIGEQNGIYVTTEPRLLEDTNAVAEAVRQKLAEVFAVTTTEFLALENHCLEGPLIVARVGNTLTEEYLLLARADRPWREVEDLKGVSLNVASDVRSCLVSAWLEVLCRERGLDPADRVFGKTTSSTKTTHVVLPVFFGKTDACVVTRNSWKVMCEMNPQLEKQLRIVAASPPLVPALTCFRTGLSENLKQKIIKAVELSAGKPAYGQLMTLFKSDEVVVQPLDLLGSTRALMEQLQIPARTADYATARDAARSASSEEVIPK